MKKLAIIYSEYTSVIDAIKYNLSDCKIEIFQSLSRNEDDFDLIIKLNGGVYGGNALACHHSLLPAFNCENPEKQAILEGVKVTGITFYMTKSKKIVYQYPIFIKNETHFDDLEKELEYLEQALFPIIVKNLINNKPIELQNNCKKSCCGNCTEKQGECKKCSH